MPYYTYINPHSGETKDVFQHMEDEHKYIEDGIVWERVFGVPQANIDAVSSIDPFNKQQFMDKTNKTILFVISEHNIEIRFIFFDILGFENQCFNIAISFHEINFLCL